VPDAIFEDPRLAEIYDPLARITARRALSLTFFVAQRKAEDPVVEVEVPD